MKNEDRIELRRTKTALEEASRLQYRFEVLKKFGHSSVQVFIDPKLAQIIVSRLYNECYLVDRLYPHGSNNENYIVKF